MQARGSGTRAAGGRPLSLVCLPRAWAHADRQRHARSQHAEAARLAAANATPRMHAAHARRTQARGSGTRAAAAIPATGDFRRPHRSSRTSGAVRSTTNSRDFRRENLSAYLCTCAWTRPRTHKWAPSCKALLPSQIEADPNIGRRTPQKHAGTSQRRISTESRARSGRPAMKRTRGRAISRNARPRRVRRLRTAAPTAVTRPQPPAVA